jgi:hypothetical protein
VQPPLEQHLTEPSLIILPKMLIRLTVRVMKSAPASTKASVQSSHIDKHTVYMLNPEIRQTGAFVKEFKMYFSAIL